MKHSWIQAHLAEADVIEGRLRRMSWRAGSVVTFVAVAVSSTGGTMKISLVALSLVNLFAGLALVVLWFVMGREPMIVLGLAAVLIVQGGSTLLYVSGAFDRVRRAARNVLVAGSAAALAVGAAGFITGVVVNLQPANPDPEYGPMSVAFLLAAHGCLALVSTIADGRGHPLPS